MNTWLSPGYVQANSLTSLWISFLVTTMDGIHNYNEQVTYKWWKSFIETAHWIQAQNIQTPLFCMPYLIRNTILFDTYLCTNTYKTPKHSVFASQKTLKCMKKSGLKRP